MAFKVKTDSGFKVEIEEERLTNYELVEAIVEEETNPLATIKIVNLLLGKDVGRLKDHVRDENGLVDSNKIGLEIKDIFDKVKALKN